MSRQPVVEAPLLHYMHYERSSRLAEILKKGDRHARGAVLVVEDNARPHAGDFARTFRRNWGYPTLRISLARPT